MKDLNFSSSILLEQFDCLQMTLNEEITLIGIGNAYVKQINKQDDQIINISLSLHLDGNVKTTKKNYLVT